MRLACSAEAVIGVPSSSGPFCCCMCTISCLVELKGDTQTLDIVSPTSLKNGLSPKRNESFDH